MLPYDEAGSGPPVVLLHAGIADRSMWREHLEPLAAALPPPDAGENGRLVAARARVKGL